MKTIEIDKPSNPVAMYLGALLSCGKRAGSIKSLPSVTYVRPHVVLDSAHIAQYANLCGLPEAQGVPITYPQLLTFPLLMAFIGSVDCPWPAMGTVHLANRIAQRQRLNPGDALRVEVTTGHLFAHDKGQVFTLEMKVLRDGDTVWEATQSLLRTGVKNPAGPPFSAKLNQDTPLSHQADFLAAGDTGRRYGLISGDLNPIHISALSARLFGFRRAIAHGMWTSARALPALLPAEAVTQAELTVEFKTPLWLPARPSLWATRATSGPFSQNALFEVRDARGDKPHLRGHLSCQ